MYLKRRMLGLGSIVLCSILPLLLSVPGFSQEYYDYVLGWVIPGLETSNGHYPSCFAVDSQDNLYVCDDGNCRIQKFDSDGNFILSWGSLGTEDGQFSWPRGIAIDKDDNVYVTDILGNRVQKFDASGNFILKWDLYHPFGIACDLAGNVYVVCWDQNAVRKFTPSGESLGGFGYLGDPRTDTDPFNFVYPGYIAVNSKGEIYVSVWGEYYCGQRYPHDPLPDPNIFDYHSQIKKFDSNFQYLTRWYLDAVTAITIDAQDNVYACSQRDWEMGVYKYDSIGNLIQQIAPTGFGEGEILSPHAVAVDSGGSVYVVNYYQYKVQKFAPPYVPYTFDGFFPPIENAPVVNQAKAGQTIPVKWRILDKDGLPVYDPASFVGLTSYPVSCSSFEGDPTNQVEESAAGDSGLQYLGDGWWQYNWKTSKTYAGQCRTMKLTLDDKTEHTASFSFK